MATLSAPIDTWTDATVRQLVTNQVSESLTVEFKRDLPMASASDKREIAKDISAMANSAGGWIIYGIDEQVGANGLKVAHAVSVLTTPNDAAHRIDDVIAGSCTPRPHFRVREIATAGGFFVVVHVTASPDDLHMITDNRFYRRSEQGARPMTQPEIRQAYELIARRQSDARAWVRGVMEDELVGAPSAGFGLILVPHTMRDVLNPAGVKVNAPGLSFLDHEYKNDLRPHEHGLQAIIGDAYRFRLRRDGTLSLFFEAHHDGGWLAGVVLRELLIVLAIARKVWPREGIIESATLGVRVRLPSPLGVLPRSARPRPPTLPANQAFEIPVSASKLYDAPLEVARAVLDRLFQAMGDHRCPFFDDSGQLRPDVQRELAVPIAAATS